MLVLLQCGSKTQDITNSCSKSLQLISQGWFSPMFARKWDRKTMDTCPANHKPECKILLHVKWFQQIKTKGKCSGWIQRTSSPPTSMFWKKSLKGQRIPHWSLAYQIAIKLYLLLFILFWFFFSTRHPALSVPHNFWSANGCFTTSHISRPPL